MGRKITKKGLTAKEELFCRLFASDKECFGNGTQAYIKAFSTKEKKPTYGTARVKAHELLTKDNVIARIRELMDVYISDEVVDAELAKVILQWADIPSKVSAVREYNRVKGRLAPTKFKFVDDNEDLTDEEIEQQIASRKKKS